jgi:molybdopterin/thiamine biosynthesis adenylyltransferase
MDPDRSSRYLRHDLIDWLSQDELSQSRVAVVGAGAIGNEVIKNLALLGVGRIDVFDFDTVELHNLTRSIFLREADVGRNKAEAVADRASEVDPGVTLSAIAGDFWNTLDLQDLTTYTGVIGAVDNFEARLKLNQLCQIAQVNLVNTAMDSRWVSVESYPFSLSQAAACYECHLPDSAYARVAERYSCGGLRRRGVTERKIPTTAITASVAGALAVSTALRLGDARKMPARRMFVDTIGGGSRVTELVRREQCPGCEAFEREPRLVNVGNRWTRRATAAERGTAGQVLRLSDALITAYRCANCGEMESADHYINRRAVEFDDSIVLCPGCGKSAIQIEIRHRFRLQELIDRFGERPVPVKYALTEIDGVTVCFNFGEETK